MLTRETKETKEIKATKEQQEIAQTYRSARPLVLGFITAPLFYILLIYVDRVLIQPYWFLALPLVSMGIVALVDRQILRRVHRDRYYTTFIFFSLLFMIITFVIYIITMVGPIDTIL